MRLILYILGIIIISISMTFIYLYTNLFTLGYTFFDYIVYIIKRWECLMMIVGIILVGYSMRRR